MSISSMSIIARVCIRCRYLSRLDGRSGHCRTIGERVIEWQPGDRVAWAMAPGSYAEYAVVPESKLVRVPDGIDTQTAAAVMLQGMTAHYLTRSTFPLKRAIRPSSTPPPVAQDS